MAELFSSKSHLELFLNAEHKLLNAVLINRKLETLSLNLELLIKAKLNTVKFEITKILKFVNRLFSLNKNFNENSKYESGYFL